MAIFVPSVDLWPQLLWLIIRQKLKNLFYPDNFIQDWLCETLMLPKFDPYHIQNGCQKIWKSRLKKLDWLPKINICVYNANKKILTRKVDPSSVQKFKPLSLMGCLDFYMNFQSLWKIFFCQKAPQRFEYLNFCPPYYFGKKEISPVPLIFTRS